MKNQIIATSIGIIAAMGSIAGMGGLIASAQAEEVVYASSKMKITHAQFGFAMAANANLVLLSEKSVQKPGPSAMELTFEVPNSLDHQAPVTLIQRRVEIVESYRDECGSVTYVAQLAQPIPTSGIQNPVDHGARFNIVLTDHSDRICEDFRPYAWEANVREGFGWCGTGDSTMEMVGSPKVRL